MEAEQTITQAFILGCKTRHWLSRPDCPQAIKECKALYDKAYRKHGSPLNQDVQENNVPVNAPKEARRTNMELPFEMAIALDFNRAPMKAHLTLGEFVYSRAETHVGNSLVIYRDGEATLYGSIQVIFCSPDGAWKCAVKRQLPMPEGEDDIYASYQDFPARMISNSWAEQPTIIDPSDIVGHYARWKLTEELSAILPLHKVLAFLRFDTKKS